MGIAVGRMLHTYPPLEEDLEMEEEFLILLTLKESHPYDSWNVKEIAKEKGLCCAFSFAFDRHLYPGYSHVNTIGNYSAYHSKKLGEGTMFPTDTSRDDNLKEKKAKTFVFCMPSSGK